MSKTYDPKPVDTNDVSLPDGLNDLVEDLAKHAHDIWAKGRIKEGWSYGQKRDDDKKEHPDLIPYGDLSDGEKDYDRNTALGSLKLIFKLGYKIIKD